MNSPPQEGFSAQVHLKLLVDDQPVELAQVGPRSLRLRQPCNGIEGKLALLVIRVGRTLKKREILLTRVVPDDPHEIEYI